MDVKKSSLPSSKKQKLEHHNKSRTITIECLPEELNLQICSYVASKSTIDTMNLKMVSKKFLRICSDDQVLRCSAYPEYPSGWYSFESKNNYHKYIKSLRNAGNPYALFHAGIENVKKNVSKEKRNKGLRQLIQAAEGGCTPARYLVGIALYCWGGEGKQKGIDYLTKITKPSDSMTIILKELEAYRQNMSFIIIGGHWEIIVNENRKEDQQYEHDTVKCTCNGIGRKWFKDYCRWVVGKDIDSRLICQVCLSEEIVNQFFRGY